jgi:CHAT domain-containing protein/tetratricopeptide (TPR) repeat protein
MRFPLCAALAVCALARAGPPEPTLPAPVSGTIGPGQTRIQELALAAGQRLHLKLEHAHLDGEVRVFGPEGTILGSVDNAIARPDPLTVTVISTALGLHRVEIRLRSPRSMPGAFRLLIDPPSAASEADRSRMEAERLRAQADQRALHPESAGAAAAGEEYQRSGAIWRKLDDPLELAVTLSREAQFLEQHGELQPAKRALEEALILWRRAGHAGGEVDCLDLLGLVTAELDDPVSAVKLSEEALALRRRVGPDPVSEASILNNLAIALGDQGELWAAIERYTEALQFARQAGDATSEAMILKNRAADLATVGQVDRALADYRQTQALFRALKDARGEALNTYSIGTALLNADRPAEAARYYRESLPALERVGDSRFVAFAWDKLGHCDLRLRRYAQARREFQIARETFKRIGDRRNIANTELSLARTLLDEGRAGEALEGLRRAREQLHAVGDRDHESGALTHLARAERALGHLDDARLHVLEALKQVEALRGKIVGPTARASYLATQHLRYRVLIDVLMDLHARDPAAGWDAQALGASETVRARSLLELLADARADVRDEVPPGLRDQERALNKRLDAQLREQERVLKRAHTAAEADAMERSLEELRAQAEEIQARMRASSPSYAGLTRPSPLTLAEIRSQVLDPSSVLVEYFLGEEGSFVWVVSSTGLSSARLPPRTTVERAAARLYRAWSSPGGLEDGRAAAAALSRMVLAPVAPALRGKRLLVAAAGALERIPFGALPEPGSSRALLEEHELVSVPSASALAVLRAPRPAAARPAFEVAVLADPVFSAEDRRLRVQGTVELASLAPDLARSLEDTGLRHLEPLAATRREAEAIAAHAGMGRTLAALGFEASRATALGENVARARVVHLASHALLDPKRPELSGIVLSLVDESGKPQDGFLSMGDVYRMRLAAELVVLSACQTGLGKELRGEGLLGLTRGFMRAGAPRVVASLWKVSDQATAALMDQFYRALLLDKVSPAAALRSAQLALKGQRRFAAPFDWAGFILQGEWRPMSP